MANKTRSTFQKRQKELARQARRKEKEAKRLEKKAEGDVDAAADAAADTAEDPDLVGIRLGPQRRGNEDEADENEAESGR